MSKEKMNTREKFTVPPFKAGSNFRITAAPHGGWTIWTGASTQYEMDNLAGAFSTTQDLLDALAEALLPPSPKATE